MLVGTRVSNNARLEEATVAFRACITQASLGGGRSAGMIAAIGTTLGVAAYATATLLGISALSAALPWLITIIQVLGGLYLVYLGIEALRAAIRGEGSFTMAERLDKRLSIARTFSKALLVSLGNPKMAAFFFGLFAPLVDPSHSADARLLVLGGVLLIDLIYHQVLATILVPLARLGDTARRVSEGAWGVV